MKECNRTQCLNNDKDYNHNCITWETVTWERNRCNEFINAQGAMKAVSLDWQKCNPEREGKWR